MIAQGTWRFTEEEKKTILSLLTKGRKEQERNQKFAIINFDNFYKLFSQDEISIMKKYLAIKPEEIGYKLPYFGLVDTPVDIVPIADQTYELELRKETIPCQYLPKRAYEAFLKLNDAMGEELHKRVLVLYGYRSPARQVFMFFDILERIYNFDFNKTIKRVCLPAFSEHVFPEKQAIDFMTLDGIKGEGFEKTDEYTWLKENARKFNFIESYPLNNNLDMMYEPWHWSYNS